MAVWKLNRKYPATVKGFDPETGCYLVEFYDQVQSNVKPTQIRKMRKDEELNHLTSNGDMRTDDDAAAAATNDENVDKQTTETSTNAEEGVAKPITPKGR